METGLKIRLDPLDKLFSEFIRLRANNKCERCGVYKETKQLQTSHFHGRRKKSVRWDEDNAAGLCFACHQYLGENPLEHYEWFRDRLGEGKFHDLNIRANFRGVKPDINGITLYLREKIKELKEGI